MNTNEELKQLKILKIDEYSSLTTVSVKETMRDLWVDFIDDFGDRCTLYSDIEEWKNGRKRVTYYNNHTGERRDLFFKTSEESFELHEYTLNDSSTMEIFKRIPNPVINLVVERSK